MSQVSILKPLMLSLVSACAFLTGVAQSADSGAAEEAPIASIESLIRSQNFDEALDATKACLRQTPTDYRLWTLEGIVLSLKRNSSDAVNAFEKALHLSPTYAPALKGEVQILFQADDKRAVPLLQRILKADPRDLIAHEMLGTLREETTTVVPQLNISRSPPT